MASFFLVVSSSLNLTFFCFNAYCNLSILCFFLNLLDSLFPNKPIMSILIVFMFSFIKLTYFPWSSHDILLYLAKAPRLPLFSVFYFSTCYLHSSFITSIPSYSTLPSSELIILSKSSNLSFS